MFKREKSEYNKTRSIIFIPWLVIENYERFFEPELPRYDVFRFDGRIR